MGQSCGGTVLCPTIPRERLAVDPVESAPVLILVVGATGEGLSSSVLTEFFIGEGRVPACLMTVTSARSGEGRMQEALSFRRAITR